MKKTILCAVALVAFATPAMAGAKYDRQLEKAVMEIVAKNIGELRGGFDYNEKPVLIIVRDTMSTGSISRREPPPARRPDARDHDWKYGLALASERRVSRIISF